MRRYCIGVQTLFMAWMVAAALMADDRQPVRVQYYGNLTDERATDFRSFLEEHFTNVTATDAHEFKEEQTKTADVVIFDWSGNYNGKGDLDEEKYEQMRTIPPLSENFSRPAILIGARGGNISQKLKLKTNWLCLCMEGPAHHVRTDHPVFHHPLEVNPEFQEVPTEGTDRFVTLEKPFGPTIKVWRVQSKDYPDIDPGLVSDLYGFDDSPDAEIIAQGTAMKGPDTLSLGRHGNFFTWGFSAPPSIMTPSGQRLFINVICYMKQFDGQTPIVHRVSESREWALRHATLPRFLSDDFHQESNKETRQLFAKRPEFAPEEYKSDPEKYLAKRDTEGDKSNRSYFESVMPDSLRKQFGMDADKYLAYFQENFEYLRPDEADSNRFVVDEDVKVLGISSNRRPELLEKCISLLENGQQTDVALRLLKRYTSESFDTADQWRAWFNQNRDRLFFSDVGGYKFFVNPNQTIAKTASKM